MTEEATFPTYGFGKDGPKLFELKEGEGLPKGYYDHPDKVPARKSKEDAVEAETGPEVSAEQPAV